MIHAMGWCSAESLGHIGAGGSSWKALAPDLSAGESCPHLSGGAVRNYARMPTDVRRCLGAASQALRAAGWPGAGVAEIGLLGTGYAGCLAADLLYFKDYVDHGRLIGLANLFVYTLPTSALGELAIALKLTGPSQHIHHDGPQIARLLRHAERLVADEEADGVLALWSDQEAAVCIAVSDGACPGGPEFTDLPEMRPSELVRYVAARAHAVLIGD